MESTNNCDRATLTVAYQEVCRAHDSIQEFRAKLLGLLPLASGTGIFLLLTESTKLPLQYLPAVGAFGFLITLGLFFYELGGMVDCLNLLLRGQDFESRLKLPPQTRFIDPGVYLATWAFVVAAWVIYVSVLLGWSYVAYACIKKLYVFVPAALVAATALPVLSLVVVRWQQRYRGAPSPTIHAG